jgi:dihydroorotate dehydrogenase (fumarate)
MDLKTKYLGIILKNPLVVSACPLSEEVDNIRKMEDAGASAVVLESLFEEQIQLQSHMLDRILSENSESFAESLTYFPDMNTYNLGPEGYLESIRKAKAAVNIPIIASLNGITTGGWLGYAKKIEQAGADALELNAYYVAANSEISGAAVEQMYVELVKKVKASVKIPVAVKLGPYFSSTSNMATRLDAAGANALVLFNRFYQPDFDLESLEVVPTLHLSTPDELLLRIHWVGTLYGRVRADLAVTGGVHSAQDVLKSMMAGAKAVMMASVLLKRGIPYLRTIQEGIQKWMEEHEYGSIALMQGSMSQKSVEDPAAFQRANYMRVIGSYSART